MLVIPDIVKREARLFFLQIILCGLSRKRDESLLLREKDLVVQGRHPA
jgi:hypothetical protein